MKELKSMREIRHANVNNFIGAMVENVDDNIKLVTGTVQGVEKKWSPP